MTILPAPYESVADDDLGSAVGAALTGALAGLLAVSLGAQAWRQIPDIKNSLDLEDLEGNDLATVLTTIGWGLGAVLLGLGAILLFFRRGRGAVMLGSLIATAATLIARYAFDWFTPAHPMDNAIVYYGGIAVFLLAAMPATKRWVSAPRRPRSAMPAVTTATPMTRTSGTVRIGRVG